MQVRQLPCSWDACTPRFLRRRLLGEHRLLQHRPSRKLTRLVILHLSKNVTKLKTFGGLKKSRQQYFKSKPSLRGDPTSALDVRHFVVSYRDRRRHRRSLPLRTGDQARNRTHDSAVQGRAAYRTLHVLPGSLCSCPGAFVCGETIFLFPASAHQKTDGNCVGCRQGGASKMCLRYGPVCFYCETQCSY